MNKRQRRMNIRKRRMLYQKNRYKFSNNTNQLDRADKSCGKFSLIMSIIFIALIIA
jgi:hypothetical protein